MIIGSELIFHSCVSLPEGIYPIKYIKSHETIIFLRFPYGFPCLVGALQLELARGWHALPSVGGPAAAAQRRAQLDARAAQSGPEPWADSLGETLSH